MFQHFIIKEFIFVIIILSTVIGFAIQKINENKEQNEHEQYQHHHEHQHNTHEHYSDNGHNLDYDHESFLGHDTAREFDELSPEESKERLNKIVDKIDTNNDGYVSENELKEWITKLQKNYIVDDVDRQWSSYELDRHDKLSWELYQKKTYGFMQELNQNTEDNSINNDNDLTAYKEMMRRDQRRWKVADQDQDGDLTKDEFTSFLHPEEAEHMKDVVVEETLEDIDKDKDGRISIDEYINDMYATDANDDQVPDWVIREKEQFNNFRDKNKDGYMDNDEIREWIIPLDYDHAQSEAKHLISEADKNKDGLLSKEEILESYDLFVGSQATDFGEVLTQQRFYDEF